MGCIEIALTAAAVAFPPLFNRNMGCIEITVDETDRDIEYSLIETWDVLKYFLSIQFYFHFPV